MSELVCVCVSTGCTVDEEVVVGRILSICFARLRYAAVIAVVLPYNFCSAPRSRRKNTRVWHGHDDGAALYVDPQRGASLHWALKCQCIDTAKRQSDVRGLPSARA